MPFLTFYFIFTFNFVVDGLLIDRLISTRAVRVIVGDFISIANFISNVIVKTNSLGLSNIY